MSLSYLHNGDRDKGGNGHTENRFQQTGSWRYARRPLQLIYSTTSHHPPCDHALAALTTLRTLSRRDFL